MATAVNLDLVERLVEPMKQSGNGMAVDIANKGVDAAVGTAYFMAGAVAVGLGTGIVGDLAPYALNQALEAIRILGDFRVQAGFGIPYTMGTLINNETLRNAPMWAVGEGAYGLVALAVGAAGKISERVGYRR